MIKGSIFLEYKEDKYDNLKTFTIKLKAINKNNTVYS